MEFTIEILVAAVIVIIGFILGPIFKNGIIKMSEKSAPAQGALTFIGNPQLDRVD